MGVAFAEIAFTPGVRELQTQAGSRERYAAMDESTNRRDKLTEREITFIESRDHFFQASVSETGWPYVQHRGGPAGFLKVIDERTLGFADYRGNVQYVSVGNLLHDNRVALILMDYANQRRLKLLGHVRFIDQETEPELIERLVTTGYKAIVERGFIISVEAFDWNCPQHIPVRIDADEVQRALDERAPRDDEHVLALAADRRLAERHHVVLSGVLALVVGLAIEVLVLEVQHRVGAADRRAQQARRIHGVAALTHDIDADIRGGEVLAIVGENGAGKSTLMKVMIGQLEADEGGIEMPRKTRLGYIAQEAPSGSITPFEAVLAGDAERAQLLAEAQSMLRHWQERHQPGHPLPLQVRPILCG